MRPLLLTLLAACGPAPETLIGFEAAVAQARPDLRPAPSQALRLAVGPTIPNGSVRVVITGLMPNERVFLGRGVGIGAGACLAAVGGLCLDILGPASLIGQLRANASGIVDQVFTLPAMPYGNTIGLQAVTFRGAGGIDSAKSNAVRRVTTAGIDTLDDVITGGIVISEIMNNPNAVADSAGEWFELYNAHGTDLDLLGLEFSDLGGESFVIDTPTLLPANSWAVFGRRGDPEINGGTQVDLVYSGLTLGNGADELILSYNGIEIDAVVWDGGASFPNPTGRSMSLDARGLDASSNDQGLFWCEASSAFGDGDRGTPGSANDACNLTPPSFTTDEDFETGDFSLFPWSFTGPQPWTIETDATACYEGSFCMRSSPAHPLNTASESNLALSVREDTTIGFWARTDTEPGEYVLRFSVDGVEQVALSGLNPWTYYSFDVAATGANGPDRLLTWSYERSDFFPVDHPPYNRVWIDGIDIPDFNTPPSVPTWSSPATGLLTAADPTFAWSSDDLDFDPVTYLLEVDTDPAFGQPTSSGETFADMMQMSLGDGTWHARVRARDGVDYRWTAWSPTITVTVDSSTGDDSWALQGEAQLALADVDGPRRDGDRIVATADATTNFVLAGATAIWPHGSPRYGVPKSGTMPVPTDLPVGTSAAIHVDTVGPWDPGSIQIRVNGELVIDHQYPGTRRTCYGQHGFDFVIPNIERFSAGGEIEVEFTPYLLDGCTNPWTASLSGSIDYRAALPGTVTSPPMVHTALFDGDAFWDKLTWSGSGEASVQVLDGAGALVPDEVLPGNAAGFTNPVVPLYAVDPAAWPTLQLQTTLGNHASLQSWSVTGGDDLVWAFEDDGQLGDLVLDTPDATALLEVASGVLTLSSTTGGPDPAFTLPFATPISAARFSELSLSMRTSNNYINDDVTVSWASDYGAYDARRSFTQTAFLFQFTELVFDLGAGVTPPNEPWQGMIEGLRVEPVDGFVDQVGAQSTGWAEIDWIRLR